jgi:FkbM family methyltransferase
MPRIGSAAELQAYYRSIRAANNGQWIDFEPIIQSVYERLLAPGDTAIDGGASVGRHTFPMARKVVPYGAVFAIEPLRRFAWLLRAKALVRHPQLRRVIRIREVALSNSSGTAEFLEAEEPAYSGLRPRIYPRSDMRVRKRRVRVDRLDNLIPPSSPVRFLKLDLEGGEFDAMRGGIRLIETHRPVIVFEYDRRYTPEFYGFQHADLLEFFEHLGYRLVDILGIPFDDRSLWDAAEVWYYVALPRERELESVIWASEPKE